MGVETDAHRIRSPERGETIKGEKSDASFGVLKSAVGGGEGER